MHGSAAEGEEAEESEDNGSAAEGEDSVGDDDGATSESSGSDPGETELEMAQRAENNILRERIRGMIEAEGYSEDIDAGVFDAEDDEDCYDDCYLGMVVKLGSYLDFPSRRRSARAPQLASPAWRLAER